MNVLDNIYHTMRKFTPVNARQKGKRHRALRGASLIFPGAQRLEVIQAEFLQSIELGKANNLSIYYTYLIHDWSHVGKISFGMGVIDE
jgi:hypothetical protein